MSEIDFGELSFINEIVDVREANVGYLKILIYGPPGTGKTFTLATLPDPSLILLTESHGDMSLRTSAEGRYEEDEALADMQSDIQKRTGRRVFLRYVRHTKDKNGKVIKSAKVKIYETIDELSFKRHPFKSLGLDSITDAQTILQYDLKGGQLDAKMHLDEWGKLISQTKDLAIRLRNLNMHVAVTALANEAQDDQNRLIYRPDLSGKKLPSSVIQYFNLCAFQTKERDANQLSGFRHVSKFQAGDEAFTKSHPALNPVEEPDISMWAEKISSFTTSHKQGELPMASRPIDDHPANQERKLLERLQSLPMTMAIMNKMEIPRGARLATVKKYENDANLFQAVKAGAIKAGHGAWVAELEKKHAPKKAEPEKKAAKKAPPKESSAPPQA